MALSLIKNSLVRKVADYASAATSAVNSSIIDMSGYEAAVFVGNMGTASASNYMTIQGGNTNAAASMSDLEGTKVTPASDGDAMVCEIVRPLYRYMRAQVTRGASTTCGAIYAIKCHPHKAPQDNDETGYIKAESHVSPSQGTA